MRNYSAAFTRLSAKRHLDQPFDGWGRLPTNLRSPFLTGFCTRLEPFGCGG
ncbi:MAG: hypothetical protein MSG64_10640 [Pyrinomonadaceae bacterium MAG19_C2-C3]|nr:hypothetical protein [Pyrinomonadaceae bacterium MAG19_C2-C3]